MTTSGPTLDECSKAGVNEGLETWRQIELGQLNETVDDAVKIAATLLGMLGRRDLLTR